MTDMGCDARMIEKRLVVHDGRLPGGLGASVYARLLQRSGARVEVKHVGLLEGSLNFWKKFVPDLCQLPEAKHTSLALFGVNYLDIDPTLCEQQLRLLEDTFADLEIWTHRWPDGYMMKRDVRTPPEDIVYGDLGVYLAPDEKRMLRLSLVAARTIPYNSAEADEHEIVARLAARIGSDPSAWDDFASALNAEFAGSSTVSAVAEDFQQGVSLVRQDRSIGLIELSLNANASRREIPAIDAYLGVHQWPIGTTVVAWLDDGRLLVYRRQDSNDSPSIRWLLDNQPQADLPLPLRDLPYGPQDSVYFRTHTSLKAEVSQEVWEALVKLTKQTTGGRYLVATVARSVAVLATKLLGDLDLRNKYTKKEDPRIAVDAGSLYVLTHASSRTGSLRQTLTVPITTLDAESVAFLSGNGGYNLLKLEKMLEGALIGLKERRLAWLREEYIPDRLRVDVVTPSEIDIDQLRQSMRAPLMTSFEREDDLVRADSVIGRCLDHLEMTTLVSYADSETIGPSVAHALTLLAAASVRGLTRKRHNHQAQVLDLFAGSGVANRLLSRHGHQVVSVDLYVDIRTLELDNERDGLWLKADASDILRPDGAILDRNYDVIGLDPPHSELIEILFGASRADRSVAQMCAARSDVLVMYQGHSTQRGRLRLVEQGLRRAGWAYSGLVVVDEELIVVAAHGDHFDRERFTSFMNQICSEVLRFSGQMRIEISVRPSFFDTLVME